MMLKTHLAIGIFIMLVFLPFVTYKIPFILIGVFACVLPDFDTRFSKFGRNPIARIMQLFTTHRGAVHSITVCTIFSLILAVFIPMFCFGFFLGYSSHLLADSFTEMGIMAFWPSKKLVSKGFVKTGKTFEKLLFWGFAFGSVLLSIFYIVNYFELV